ncbi:MAG: hypothetical protein VW378_00505 [bacterium]
MPKISPYIADPKQPHSTSQKQRAKAFDPKTQKDNQVLRTCKHVLNQIILTLIAILLGLATYHLYLWWTENNDSSGQENHNSTNIQENSTNATTYNNQGLLTSNILPTHTTNEPATLTAPTNNLSNRPFLRNDTFNITLFRMALTNMCLQARNFPHYLACLARPVKPTWDTSQYNQCQICTTNHINSSAYDPSNNQLPTSIHPRYGTQDPGKYVFLNITQKGDRVCISTLKTSAITKNIYSNWTVWRTIQFEFNRQFLNYEELPPYPLGPWDYFFPTEQIPLPELC